MMEFIVLGQVPGTNIQISFGWFLLSLLIGVAITKAMFYASHKTVAAVADKRLVRPGKV